MQKLIDVFIVRGFLVVMTFAKRHPWLTAFLVLLLFLIMSLPNFILGLSGALAAKAGLQAVANAAAKAVDWLNAGRGRWWGLAALAFFFHPLAGAFFGLWLMLDKTKPGAESATAPAAISIAPETEDLEWEEYFK